MESEFQVGKNFQIGDTIICDDYTHKSFIYDVGTHAYTIRKDGGKYGRGYEVKLTRMVLTEKTRKWGRANLA